MGAGQKLTPEEQGDLNEVLGEILEILFAEANEQIAERTGKPGARIPYSDRIKIDLASKILALTKRYDAEAKFGKFVECSNVIIPCLDKALRRAADRLETAAASKGRAPRRALRQSGRERAVRPDPRVDGAGAAGAAGIVTPLPKGEKTPASPPPNPVAPSPPT